MKTVKPKLFWIVWIAQLAFIPACSGKKDGNEGDARRQAGGPSVQPAAITLTPAAVAAAGITTTPVLKKNFRKRFTAPGELEFNARRLRHLTALAAGRVERVMVVVGDRVGAGQALAEIYCPEFMAKQAEFLQAAERAERLGAENSDASAARAFLEHSRERLILIGATAAELAELGRTGTPRPFLPVRAPLAGTVIASELTPGDRVELGSSLFRLADPSALWAGLHIQEKDLASAAAGSTVEISTQAYPGEIFPGRLFQVGDVLDARTRTVIAWAEVANPAGRLKAGMYIEASLTGGMERTLLVLPEAAVQEDEGRAIVFIQTAEGVFARREIKTGERFLGLVEILAGVSEGEKAVSSGSFLLKSELNKDSLEE